MPVLKESKKTYHVNLEELTDLVINDLNANLKPGEKGCTRSNVSISFTKRALPGDFYDRGPTQYETTGIDVTVDLTK